MDNFTHSLAGWVLGQTGLKSKSRKGLAALILGANMPDIDVFFGGSCWVPLATHRGFTHGLVGGVLLLPPILAGLLWLLDRWQVKRGATFRSGLEMRFAWLVVLAYLGSLTHPLLDLQNSYAVQLLSPIDFRWFHMDNLFIIDVWLWSGVAFAIWLSRRRQKRGENWRRPARIAVAAWLAYLGVNTAITADAKAKLLAASGTVPDLIVASPMPAEFYRRDLLYRADGWIGRATYAPWSGVTLAREPLQRDNMADPLIRPAIAASPEIKQFLRWSIAPVATVRREGCRATVTVTDARYSDNRFSRGNFERQVTLPVNGEACPAVGPVRTVPEDAPQPLSQ